MRVRARLHNLDTERVVRLESHWHGILSLIESPVHQARGRISSPCPLCLRHGGLYLTFAVCPSSCFSAIFRPTSRLSGYLSRWSLPSRLCCGWTLRELRPSGIGRRHRARRRGGPVERNIYYMNCQHTRHSVLITSGFSSPPSVSSYPQTSYTIVVPP